VSEDGYKLLIAASLRAKRVALQGVMLQIWRAGRT